jgi:non-ribosomal peptide synthetase component F
MPAGRGLMNYTTMILDQDLRVVPPGEMGELCLGGAGMTRGYHNRPELNAKAFVQNPFLEHMRPKFDGKSPRWDLIYRTGDLFRWTEQGWLQYSGRADTQVTLMWRT